jgi:mannose-6-phosphate isomerase-like protein (cupin superfamily)
MRRVVIGSDSDGRSVVASDDEVVAPASGFVTVWDGDAPPLLPSDGQRPAVGPAFFPPPGGFRTVVFSMAPESSRPPVQDTEAERVATIRGALRRRPDDAPGMHQTDTVDIEYVLDGEIDLELDNGVEVHLSAGQWVVQNGTRHSWHNRGTRPCTIIAFFVGASRDE